MNNGKRQKQKEIKMDSKNKNDYFLYYVQQFLSSTMEKDKNKKKQACEICNKKFTIWLPQHVCKRCFRSVCKDCADKKGLIFNLAELKKQQHRICNTCRPQSEFIKNYINSSSLNFNALSDKGREWLEITSQWLKTDHEGRNRATLQKPNIKDIWKQLNYSVKQFIGICLGKTNNFMDILQSGYQRLLFQVNGEINHRISSMLLLYVMCHAHQIASVQITSYLLKLLRRFNIQNIFLNLQLFEKDEGKLKMLKAYSLNNYKQFTPGLGIQALRIQAFNQILTECIINNSIQPLQNAYSYIIYTNQDLILDQTIQSSDLKKYIMQQTNDKIISKGIKLIGAKRSKIKAEKQLIFKERSSQKSQEKLYSSEESQLKKNVFQETIKPVQHLGQINASEISESIANAMKFLENIQKKTEQKNFNEIEFFQIESYIDAIIAENQNQLKEYEQMEEYIQQIQKKLKQY